jgi:endogenous inhibitor of DNA gyrase (YacG/DUF329 family)
VSDETHQPHASERTPRCPICGRPRVHEYRPFCSARCRDVDLGRWFGEAYRVPATEPGYDQDEDHAPDGESVKQ